MSRRHPWMMRTCAHIERILLGRAAAELLEEAARTPPSHDVSLVVLPVWGWSLSKVDVGRKDRDPHNPGQRLLTHVRLEWTGGPLALLEGEQIMVEMAGIGLGHSVLSRVLLDPAASPGTLEDGSLEPSSTWGPETVGWSAVRRRLHDLVRDGDMAYWDFLGHLESKLDNLLNHANAATGAHLGYPGAALDEVSLDLVRTQMVLGEDDKLSRVRRLVERCLRPDAFARVDVERYVVVSMRRDAGEEIRGAIGDTHIGAKIRRVAADLKAAGTLTSIDALIEEYRARYPGDRLSVKRATTALLAPMRRPPAVPLQDYDQAVDSHEDEVLAGMSDAAGRSAA